MRPLLPTETFWSWPWVSAFLSVFSFSGLLPSVLIKHCSEHSKPSLAYISNLVKFLPQTTSKTFQPHNQVRSQQWLQPWRQFSILLTFRSLERYAEHFLLKGGAVSFGSQVQWFSPCSDRKPRHNVTAKERWSCVGAKKERDKGGARDKNTPSHILKWPPTSS